MRKSLILFALVLGNLFIADRVVFYLLDYAENGIIGSGALGKMKVYEEESISDIDVLVYGSSRALHHVDTGMFPVPAYNMGIDGKKIAHSAALVSMLESRKKLLLVHFDHNRLFDEEYTGEDALSLLYKSFGKPETAKFYQNYFPTDYYTSRIFRSTTYNGMAFQIFGNRISEEPTNLTGYEPIVPTSEQKRIFDAMLAERLTEVNVNIVKPLKINPLYDGFVEYIQSMAREKNCRLVFFTSPSLNKVDSEVEITVKRYFDDKGIPYFNHLDYFQEFDKTLWKDYTHLSKEGAILYTSHLIELLDKRGYLVDQNPK